MTYVNDENRLAIVRGCTAPLTLTVTDADGEPFAWAGETVEIYLKRRPDDPEADALAVFAADTDDDGYADVTIPAEATAALDPGTYWYKAMLRAGDEVWPVPGTGQLDILP